MKLPTASYTVLFGCIVLFHTSSVVKDKGSEFVLGLTVLTLTKAIAKKKNNYDIKLVYLDMLCNIFTLVSKLFFVNLAKLCIVI